MSLILQCDNCGEAEVYPDINSLMSPAYPPKDWLILAVIEQTEGGPRQAQRHLCGKHNRKAIAKTANTEVPLGA